MTHSNDARLTPAQALRDGYTIDTCCYPHYAYKGDRFGPSADVRQCYTDLEAQLLTDLRDLHGAVGDFLTSGGGVEAWADLSAAFNKTETK